MVSKKYLADYRLENSLDARGKYRTVAVYIGGDYVFATPDQVTAAGKRLPLCLNLFGWLCFVGAIVTNGVFTHTVYCVIPLIACLMTLAVNFSAAYTLWRAKEPLRRYDADQLNKRLPITTLLTLVFSGISVIGAVVATVIFHELLRPGDALFGACALALAAVSAVLLHISKRFRTVKQEEEVIKRENV